MDKIEEAIEGWWGPRCDDYAKGCAACEAWRAFDAAKEILIEAAYFGLDGKVDSETFTKHHDLLKRVKEQADAAET